VLGETIRRQKEKNPNAWRGIGTLLFTFSGANLRLSAESTKLFRPKNNFVTSFLPTEPFRTY
jgi:hypothetical protein